MSKYIKPFIDASRTIVEQTTGLSLKEGETYTDEPEMGNSGLAVLIGFTGTIKGSAAFVMSQQEACEIASLMMGGFEVTEADDMTQSAIGELCNMIMGTTATHFSENDAHIDITPPTVLVGEQLSLRTFNKHVLCAPFDLGGKIEMKLYISFTEN